MKMFAQALQENEEEIQGIQGGNLEKPVLV